MEERSDNKKSRVVMVGNGEGFVDDLDEFWNWNNGEVIRFESLNRTEL